MTTARAALIDCFRAIAEACLRTVLSHNLQTATGQLAALEAIHREALELFCHAYGGRDLYVPRFEALTREARDRAIYNAFTGANWDEISQRFGVSRRQVDRILGKVAERIRTEPDSR